jgi:hypothetical protein
MSVALSLLYVAGFSCPSQFRQLARPALKEHLSELSKKIVIAVKASQDRL